MFKYEVHIDGQRVDLDPGTGFDLLLRNPMLEYGRVPGNEAAGIVLKETATNRRVLGHMNDPLVYGQSRKLRCHQVLNGNLLDEGWATPTFGGTGTEGYELDFGSSLSEFFGNLQGELLSSLNLAAVPAPADWASTVGNSWSVGGYVLPQVKNSIFYEKDPPGGWGGVVNNWDGTAYTLADKVPMFFLKKIMADLAGMAGVGISGPQWTEPLFEKLLLYNSRVATGTGMETRLHLPDITVGQMFLGLRSFLNTVLWFDGTGKRLKMEAARDVWAKPCTMDWSGKATRPKGSPLGLGGFRLSHETDSGDGLAKDAFYSAFSVGNTDSAFEVSSIFSSMKMDGIYPAVEAAGITEGQTDKKFGNRLLVHTGDATAGNVYVGEMLNPAGLAGSRFAREQVFWPEAFRVRLPVALSAADLAKVNRIFKGLDADGPFVHLHGVNYLIEDVGVPSDGAISNVGLLRL